MNRELKEELAKTRMHLKMGKRIHLREYEADSLADYLNGLLSREVEVPRIRHGKRQTLDTLISEEALLLAEFLRNKGKSGLQESHQLIFKVQDTRALC